MMKQAAYILIFTSLLTGCATGVKQEPLKYNPQTGTYTKSYNTGELGTGFVKSLLGVGD
jgi:hypothetical protein